MSENNWGMKGGGQNGYWRGDGQWRAPRGVWKLETLGSGLMKSYIGKPGNLALFRGEKIHRVNMETLASQDEVAMET
jgi:hypothetical protein